MSKSRTYERVCRSAGSLAAGVYDHVVNFVYRNIRKDGTKTVESLLTLSREKKVRSFVVYAGTFEFSDVEIRLHLTLNDEMLDEVSLGVYIDGFMVDDIAFRVDLASVDFDKNRNKHCLPPSEVIRAVAE